MDGINTQLLACTFEKLVQINVDFGQLCKSDNTRPTNTLFTEVYQILDQFREAARRGSGQGEVREKRKKKKSMTS